MGRSTQAEKYKKNPSQKHILSSKNVTHCGKYKIQAQKSGANERFGSCISSKLQGEDITKKCCTSTTSGTPAYAVCNTGM